jgi:hypothetical protein
MPAKLNLPPIPPALVDVALIDGPTCAAAGGISLSAWHELVRLKTAPEPVLRMPRCTRWRLLDVRNWLIERASQQDADVATAMTEKARNASAAARKPEAIARARATRAANARNKPSPSSAGDLPAA